MYFTKTSHVAASGGLAWIAVVASVLSSACTEPLDPTGGGGGGSEAHGSTTTSSGGESSPTGAATGAIKVWVLVRNQPPVSLETGTTWIELKVSDANDNSLHGFHVDAMGDGKPILFETEGFATLKTPITTFDLSVTHTLGTRTGVHLVGPVTATPTLSSAPTTEAPTTLTWAPNNEAGVTSVGYTFIDIQSVWKSDTLADPGTMQLPTNAFPLSGAASVGLIRTRTWSDGDALVAQFQSDVSIDVVVP